MARVRPESAFCIPTQWLARNQKLNGLHIGYPIRPNFFWELLSTSFHRSNNHRLTKLHEGETQNIKTGRACTLRSRQWLLLENLALWPQVLVAAMARHGESTLRDQDFSFIARALR